MEGISPNPAGKRACAESAACRSTSHIRRKIRRTYPIRPCNLRNKGRVLGTAQRSAPKNEKHPTRSLAEHRAGRTRGNSRRDRVRGVPVWAVIPAPVAGLSRTYILPLSVTGCEGARFVVAGGQFVEGTGSGTCEKYDGKGRGERVTVCHKSAGCVRFVRLRCASWIFRGTRGVIHRTLILLKIEAGAMLS